MIKSDTNCVFMDFIYSRSLDRIFITLTAVPKGIKMSTCLTTHTLSYFSSLILLRRHRPKVNLLMVLNIYYICLHHRNSSYTNARLINKYIFVHRHFISFPNVISLRMIVRRKEEALIDDLRVDFRQLGREVA